MSRRAPRHIAAHPLVLGAITLIVLITGLWVSFGASKGLPFVAKYRLEVEVPNAAQLTTGAEVTIAGNRVGQVNEIRPVMLTNERPAAALDLALDPSTGPLPVDSRFSIRLTGSLGRKSVVIEPGTSPETYPDNAVVSLDQARRPAGDPIVDFDQLLNAFDRPARKGSRDTLETLGTGFAGRGSDLNTSVAKLPSLLRDLEPAMRNLADTETDLAGFVSGMSGFWSDLAPVAQELAALQGDLNGTFAALASIAVPHLQDTIALTPATLDVTTENLARARPFLRASTTLFAELRPGMAKLETASPVLADAFAAGARNLPLVPQLSTRLATGLDDVAAFAELAPVRPGVERLADTADALDPPLSFLAPAETRCTYLSLMIRNLGSVFKEEIATGTAARVGGVVVGVDANSERGPSGAIYERPPSKALGPVHSNPYPNTMAPGQPNECEAGNEPYITNRAVIGNVPGTQDATTEDTDLP